jgi:hypothetical protein
MKPWRKGWPGGKIRPHYTQSEKIKEKLGVGKLCEILRWVETESSVGEGFANEHEANDRKVTADPLTDRCDTDE